jgi:glucose-1-phosphate cytidylyltransferase
MKVVIFAGGYGTRLGGEGSPIPKPMTFIGNKPILWHIMKTYSHHGFNEFVILLGYKGEQIRRYFADYWLQHSDIKFSLRDNSYSILQSENENWEVSLIETGLETNTGGRLKKIENLVGQESFLLTYGDGVADIDINQSIQFHRAHSGLLTMTIVHQQGRFGAVRTDSSGVVSYFEEKPTDVDSWINGGFFVCDSGIFKYIEDEETVFEDGPLRSLSNENELHGFKHNGFWACLDTPRDKDALQALWKTGQAPWAVWQKT